MDVRFFPLLLRNLVLRGLVLFLATLAGLVWGQTASPAQSSQPGATVIDLPQAINRARQYGGAVQGANLALAQATEDRLQAKAANKPQISALSQYIYTEGNGTPSGVFISNDGVHVYNDQGLAHEDLMPLIQHGALLRASAAEAVARAKVDIAARGLNATVIQNYYAIADAMRKLDNAALSLTEARQFVEITQKQESGGEVSHADVVKAQLQLQQRQIDLSEAQLALAKAKIALSVVIFPDLRTDFSIRDDLDQVEVVPSLPEVRGQATATNPDVRAANAAVNEAGYDVSVARYGYLPTASLDFFYGLNSNVIGLYDPEGDRNIGAAAIVTVNIPVWNWGVTKSKVKQAELRQEQARLDLSLAQRNLQAALATAHAEADGALAQVSLLRQGVAYATDSLRLTLLRYEAGESTAFEVSDAQSAVKQARDAYDDGLTRYRVAQANLRTLMGTL